MDSKTIYKTFIDMKVTSGGKFLAAVRVPIKVAAASLSEAREEARRLVGGLSLTAMGDTAQAIRRAETAGTRHIITDNPRVTYLGQTFPEGSVSHVDVYPENKTVTVVCLMKDGSEAAFTYAIWDRVPDAEFRASVQRLLEDFESSDDHR